MYNSRNWLSEKRVAAGVMTGTSLDGVDVALVEIAGDKNSQKIRCLGHMSYGLDENIKNTLKNIIDQRSDISDISEMSFSLMHAYADCISRLCLSTGISLADVDIIGIHGQTVWHAPLNSGRYNLIPNTYQLANGSVLAQLVGRPVISDFRSADIAVGGQGAPLVPIFDYAFLSSDLENRIALNIGGMANITYLKANGGEDDVLAFDTGPGNVLIDALMQRYFGLDYDEDGAMAASGRADEELLSELMRDEFINSVGPKSTGRELYNMDYWEQKLTLIGRDIDIKDQLRTVTEWVAMSIAHNIAMISDDISELIVSGGGARNKLLMAYLRQSLPAIKISTSAAYGIDIDAKEAMCFAYLAWRSMAGLYGNMPSVTGAKSRVVLGSYSHCLG